MTIIHLVRATTWGGGERYALDLCQASVEAGHNVIVATKGSPEIDEKFSSVGTQIIHLPLGGPFDFRSPFALAKIIRDAADEEIVIHVHTFKDAEIASRAKAIIHRSRKKHSPKRIRLICTRHLVKPGKSSPRWRFIYRNIDSLIFVSHLAKRIFLESSPAIDSKKISVIHNSIILPQDISSLSSRNSILPREAVSAPAMPEVNPQQPLRLLFTGRLSPEKGLEYLINAIALLPDIPLILRIAGTGTREYIESLKALAENKGVANRIEWLGFIPDIFTEIHQADICIVPSVWREPFGLTIIEFMSQGRPVITTDNGAQSEIITNGRDGILVPPADSEAIAREIRRLAEKPSKRLEMGSNAAETFSRNFAYPIFFEKIMRLYRNH